MKVALVFGSQGEKVKPRLQEVKDNLDIDCYNNVPMLIDVTYKRNLKYDRILVLSKQLNTDVLMNDLYTFWSNIGKETEIVFLGKKGTDDALAQQFVNIFVTPVATAMLVESTTVALVAPSVLQPISSLNKEFGVAGSLNVSVNSGVVLPEIEKLNKEKKKKEELEKKRQEEERKKQETKKQKSGGLFSNLFKKKEKMKQQANKEQDNIMVEPVEQVESEENENLIQEPEYREQEPEQEYANFDVDATEYTQEEESDTLSYMQDEEPDTPSYMQDEEQDTPSYMQDEEPDTPSYEKEEETETTSDTQYVEENEFEPVEEEVNDFEPEQEVADEDFGENTYVQEEPKESEEIATVEDEDFSNMNLGQAEEEYQKANETPKVVTKTVVKEVIRNVATNTQLVDKIYNGTTQQIIIVTGDRGTGVTTAALSLAKVFSEKVHVLYMDCDVDTHGLLSYINYESFRNYGETHMQGIKLCKSVRNFENNCAVSYDTNFDILSTDYTCDVTDEELETAAGVVASIADEYGVVIVDCPVSKLHCIGDLLIQGVTVVTVEASKRGFMNMLCTLESSPLLPKYKRGIAGKGTMFITKVHKNTDIKKLVNYVKAVVDLDAVDWLSMKKLTFDGKLTDIMINSILER